MDFVLANGHLSVEFEESAAGPRLRQITHHATGEVFRFQEAQEVALVVLAPSAVNDPELEVEYTLQDAFRPDDATLSSDGISARLRFTDGRVVAEVIYELEPDAPVLRKTIRCTADKGPAYVAGVRHWMLRPETPLSWPPPDKDYAQPAVFLGDKGGFFMTLEWPGTRLTCDENTVSLEFRPGYGLKPGEARDVTVGSLGFFERGPECVEALEVARRAFLDHITERIGPKVPFPVKFTSWGPWLGQVRADRVDEVLDDLAEIGTDLLHIDAGWQDGRFTYSEKLPRVRDADDATWDREMVNPERCPDGLLPLKRSAEERGMKLSLWFDACGSVFVCEGTEWAMRNVEGAPLVGRAWESKWDERPRQSTASEYGDRLREFVLQMMERYDLGGVMFDNNGYAVDRAPGRLSMANGWNAKDVQLRRILEVLEEAGRRRPGIYRFFCRTNPPWPWALKYSTHVHAGDPSTGQKLRSASAMDCPVRALAYERLSAWRDRYEHFLPPWGIKGDIAGWSIQQKSPIPTNLEDTDEIPGVGEGWTQNMFVCLATTTVRDIRFNFRQMPAFDRRILKEWLAWDRQRAGFPLFARPLFTPSESPDEGIDGTSQMKDGRGVLYLFNKTYDLAEIELTLDESAGFRPEDRDLSAYLAYPVKTPLGSGSVSYGETVRVPVMGKDCVVIEVGLAAPSSTVAYADYASAAESVLRSAGAVFLAPLDELIEAASRGAVRVEVGDTAIDRRLAAHTVEALGAAAGRRMTLTECLDVSESDARCRLIVGTHDGLHGRTDLGCRFVERMYNRYVERDGRLVSAPLVYRLQDSEPPSYCLVGPRPEHLARLNTDLVGEVLARHPGVAAGTALQGISPTFSLAVNVPAAGPLLRFRPVVQLKPGEHCVVPSGLATVELAISAELDGETQCLWQERVPPFVGPAWWQDRVIPLDDLAGREVVLHFQADHLNRRGHPLLQIGFELSVEVRQP